MTFDEGCEFKAIWRTAAARQANGKPGHDALYDAQKRVHYATRSLKEYESNEPEQLELDLEPKVPDIDVSSEEFKQQVKKIREQIPGGISPWDPTKPFPPHTQLYYNEPPVFSSATAKANMDSVGINGSIENQYVYKFVYKIAEGMFSTVTKPDWAIEFEPNWKFSNTDVFETPRAKKLSGEWWVYNGEWLPLNKREDAIGYGYDG